MTTVTFPNHVKFTYSESFQRFYDLFKQSEQDKKFNSILAILFVLYFIIAVIVPFIEQVEIAQEIKEQVPVQLTKIIFKEKQLPLANKPKEKLIKTIKPKESKNKIVKKEPVKKPSQSSAQKRELAKHRAKASGLAAMKDELYAMREDFNITPLTTPIAGVDKSSEVKVKRKLLASAVHKQVETLSAAKVSQVNGGNELITRSTQKVRLSDQEILAQTDNLVAEHFTSGKAGQRSEMSLRRTLEAHKARLYARYNRALRKDPFLQGKVLFEIEIQPNGKISNISIKSSALNNEKLERQLLVILRSITFPKEAATVMKTIWAIDFLPT